MNNWNDLYKEKMSLLLDVTLDDFMATKREDTEYVMDCMMITFCDENPEAVNSGDVSPHWVQKYCDAVELTHTNRNKAKEILMSLMEEWYISNSEEK